MPCSYGRKWVWEEYLLKSMVGLLPPVNGKVVIDGEDLWCDQDQK